MDKTEVVEIVRKHIAGTEGKVINVSGLHGLTNLMFKVQVQGGLQFILRKFIGDIDREVENVIFRRLGELKHSPTCLYACEDYRIEQYVEGGKHLTIKELENRHKTKIVLQFIHKLHNVEITAARKIPVLAEFILTEQYFNRIKSAPNRANDPLFPILLEQLLEIHAQNDYWRDALLPESKESVKFCHNDLNNLNIFLMADDSVVFIDFQYAAYNYLAYDIANFINETCIDYTHKQPPYFSIVKRMSLDQIKTVAFMYPGYYEGLQLEVLRFMALCNLFWAGWSIKSAHLPSQGRFGTLEHGLTRVELFRYYDSLLNETQISRQIEQSSKVYAIERVEVINGRKESKGPEKLGLRKSSS